MTDATLSFNREMAQEYGVTAALIYQELKRKHFYWERQGKLVDGFFWCDQAVIADWVLVHNNTASKAIKQLEDAGLIERKVSYRPGTTTTTTWWKVKDGVTPGVTKTVTPRSHKNSDSYIKATTEATTGAREENTPRVVYLRVNPSGRAWKSQKVYSTDEEIERLENTNPEDNIEFKHWKSPKMVGDDSKAKFKYMKAKLIQPDVVDEEEMVEYGGKKYKTVPGGEVY